MSLCSEFEPGTRTAHVPHVLDSLSVIPSVAGCASGMLARGVEVQDCDRSCKLCKSR